MNLKSALVSITSRGLLMAEARGRRPGRQEWLKVGLPGPVRAPGSNNAWLELQTVIMLVTGSISSRPACGDAAYQKGGEAGES